MALFRLSRFTLNNKNSFNLIKTKPLVQTIKPFTFSSYNRYASSAVIYKNGVGMISTEIDLPHNRYALETTAPENSIHGTLWVKPKSPHLTVESLEFVQGTTEEHRLCTTIPELLQANTNQIVEVKVGSEWVRGRVGQVLAQGTTPPGQKANGLLVLDTEKGHTTVTLGDVTSLKLPFHPPENLGEADQRLLTRMDRAFKVNRLRINYKINKRKEDAIAILSYATRGLCWAPSYRLELDPKNKIGKMSMKSVIINDAQDLNADEVTCAVGLPVIRYSGVTEPLTSRGDIDTFLKNSGLDKDAASSIQEVGEGVNTAISRDKTSDVFFYTFKNVSVVKGDRVALPVFDEKDVSYTDLYYCKITGEEESNPKVLHSIKLKNSTETPWTTGPIMITENDKFIAHSNLSYSPVDGDALVKLAETLDVNVTYGVKTSGSESQKIILGKKFKSFLDTGIVHARNLKDEPITVLISKDFYGDHLSVDNGGKVTTHHLGNDINFKNTVKWELKLGPGEAKELTHAYSFLQSSD